MSEIIFIYKGYEVPIQCSQGEKMKNVMEKLYQKLNVNKDNIYALYDGNILDQELNENQISKNLDNKKIILVYDINDTFAKDKTIKNLNEVICPICNENCFIEIKDFKISLYGCKNNHKKTDILLNEYEETQKINISNIICNICKERNKGNTHNNEFYKCIDCNINICPLCKTNHNSAHNIIKYDIKNYICNKHIESYVGYCLDCKNNICISCEIDHSNHKLISYGKMLQSKNEIIEKNNVLKNDVDIFINSVKGIINKLNMIIDNIEIYYKINKNIIDNINNKNRNYEILYNINNINNNDIQNNMKNIINEKDINIQFEKLMDIHNLMFSRKIYNLNPKTSIQKISNLNPITLVVKSNKSKDNILIDNSSKSKIEEWTNRKIKSIVFDSDKDNWDSGKNFSNYIIGKSNLLFIIDDMENNRFGGYINSKITSIDTFIKDQNAFIFSLKSNNRLPGPAKFDIKHPNSAFISITTHKRYIFAFGGGYDIKLDSKKTADQANSNPSSYDFGNNKNALYGKIYPNRFTPKKWVVYQME